MIKTTIQSYSAHIFVGRRDTPGNTISQHAVTEACMEFCKHGFYCHILPASWVTPMEAMPGCLVVLTNEGDTLDRATFEDRAQRLALILLEQCKQKYVKIVFPSKTVVMSDE